jgi:hypothetical protein
LGGGAITAADWGFVWRTQAGETFAPKRRVNKALHNKPEIFTGLGDDVGLEE